MSAIDGVTAALTYNAIKPGSVRIRGSSGVPVSKWNNLVDKHDALLRRNKELAAELVESNEIFDSTVDIIEALTVYINTGRILNNQEPLRVDQIEDIVDQNMALKSIKDKASDCGLEAGIGFVTEKKDYWEHINQNVFAKYAAQINSDSEYGSSFKKILLTEFQHLPTTTEIKPEENSSQQNLEEMAKRLQELESRNKELENENKDLTYQNSKLKLEVANAQLEADSEDEFEPNYVIPDFSKNLTRAPVKIKGKDNSPSM